MTAWQSVDDVKLITTTDGAALTRARRNMAHLEPAVQHDRRLVSAWNGLTVRLTEAESVITAMYASMPGQPKAMNTEPGGGSEPPWCWNHERTVKECDKAGLPCTGEVVQRATDPTGEAATTGPDRGAYRHRRYIGLLDLLGRLNPQTIEHVAALPQIERELYHLGKNHPEQATERPALQGAETGPGDGWCISCYRLDRRYEPVALHPDGRRRYAKHCRFCGGCHADTKTDTDPDGMEPSMDMLIAHHTPGKIPTQEMFNEAHKEHLRILRLTRKHQRRATVRRAQAARSNDAPALSSEDA